MKDLYIPKEYARPVLWLLQYALFAMDFSLSPNDREEPSEDMLMSVSRFVNGHELDGVCSNCRGDYGKSGYPFCPACDCE